MRSLPERDLKFSGSLDNRCRGYSGCWLRLNSSGADVRFLRNCNCGFAACYAPAAVEALAGVKLIMALRPTKRVVRQNPSMAPLHLQQSPLTPLRCAARNSGQWLCGGCYHCHLHCQFGITPLLWKTGEKSHQHRLYCPNHGACSAYVPRHQAEHGCVGF